MTEYWLDDLKTNEKAIYVGSISSRMKEYKSEMVDNLYKSIKEILKDYLEAGNARICSLRDLSDSTYHGDGLYCYGCDVFVIVKYGYVNKIKSEITSIMKLLE